MMMTKSRANRKMMMTKSRVNRSKVTMMDDGYHADESTKIAAMEAAKAAAEEFL